MKSRKKGEFSQVYHWKWLWRGNLTLWEVSLGDFCWWKGMVKSSSESSGMGYPPHVVAEPYGGFRSCSPPLDLIQSQQSMTELNDWFLCLEYNGNKSGHLQNYLKEFEIKSEGNDEKNFTTEMQMINMVLGARGVHKLHVIWRFYWIAVICDLILTGMLLLHVFDRQIMHTHLAHLLLSLRPRFSPHYGVAS